MNNLYLINACWLLIVFYFSFIKQLILKPTSYYLSKRKIINENERNPMRSPKERILLMAPESMSALIIIVSLKEMSRHGGAIRILS